MRAPLAGLSLLLCASGALAQNIPFLQTADGRFESFDARANVSLDPEGLHVTLLDGERRPVRLGWSVAGHKLRLAGAEPSPLDVGGYYGSTELRRFEAFRSLEAELEGGAGRVVLTRGPQGVHYALALSSAAELQTLRLRHEGPDLVRIGEDGALRLHVGNSELSESAPSCHQRHGGAPLTLPCRFTDVRRELDGGFSYRIEVFGADPARPIEVDPYFDWSRYFGLEVFLSRAVAADPNGRVAAYAATRRTVNPLDGGQGGNILVGFLVEDGGHTRLREVSGDFTDEALDAVVDSSGNVVVVGYTESKNYPVTTGGWDAGNAAEDGIFSVISPTGALVSSGYLAGTTFNSREGLLAVEDVGNGEFILGGYINARFNPLSINALHNRFDGLVIRARLVPSFQHVWSLHVGGQGNDFITSLDADPAANRLYVAGYSDSPLLTNAGGQLINKRAFLTEVTFNGSWDGTNALLVGGIEDAGTSGTRAVRGNGDVVWLVGDAIPQTPLSSALRPDGGAPAIAGTAEVWVARTTLPKDGGSVREIDWLETYGGGGEERVFDAVADPRGAPLILGWSGSSSGGPFLNFGDQVGHYPDPTLRGGNFLMQLRPDGRIRHGGRFGGSRSTWSALDMDALGNAWIAFNYPAGTPEFVPAAPTFSDGGSYGPEAAVFMKLELPINGPSIQLTLSHDGGLHPRTEPLTATFTVRETRVPVANASAWFTVPGDGTRIASRSFIGDGGLELSGTVVWPPDSGLPGDTWRFFVSATNADGYDEQAFREFDLSPPPVAEDAGTPIDDGGLTVADGGDTDDEPRNLSPIGFSCGCSSSGGLALILAFAGARLLRRRRA